MIHTKYEANETMNLIGQMSPFQGCENDQECKERSDQIMDIVQANENESLLALASDAFCLGYIAGLRENRRCRNKK